MDDIKEKIKQALRHIWTNKYRLFLCLLTLCCLFGLVHYFKSADSATASISFNYSEAALGMNPNKTRFNAYEISHSPPEPMVIRLWDSCQPAPWASAHGFSQ